MSSSSSKPVALDSLELYRAALTALSVPIPPNPPSSSPPPPPSSSLIPKTRFLVDSFRTATPSSVSYFLSHFHSDHYYGLSSAWSHGVVFCSPTTSSLLSRILQVPPQFIVPLPLREPVIIDGAEVTLVDANHCPGAVQFLFKVPCNDQNAAFRMYVHTGDFRYCSSMKDDGFLKGFVGCDAVFLDTTYCNPKFVFPSQQESIDYIVDVIERVGGKEFAGSEKKVLFLVATYVIGKEKILVEIARRCNRKLLVDGRKMEVLRVLGYGESGVFTENENESDVHVVGWNVLGETWPYFRPNFVNMEKIMVERGYSRVLGFVPTGWTYEVKRNKFAVKSKDSFEIHLVPYSEHSNYAELREYVKFLRPKRVVPTVGVDVETLDSKHANKLRKHFAGLVNEMANKKEFLMGFLRGAAENDEKAERRDEFGLSGELDQEKEMDMAEMNAPDPGLVVNSPSPPPIEPMSRELIVGNDEETEKIVKELVDCLPRWVTRDQILDLISSSGKNIVEAVSNFYERETEFHEQAFSGAASIFSSEAGLTDQCEQPSKPVSVNSADGILQASFSPLYTPLDKRPSIKSGTSPGKKKSGSSSGNRKRNTDNKPKKKVKTSSEVESSGSKQSTITKFFNKILPNVSQASIVGISKKCPLDENKVTKSFREEIDHFIQIIDGNESIRDYAAAILEKTNGDINKALDLHYANPDGKLGENAERLVVSEDSVQLQCHANVYYNAQENKVAEEARQIVDLSLQGSSTENVHSSPVSLPSEMYDPVEHACWSIGEPAPYIHLARTFDLVEAERGKIKATSMLCNMFRSLLALSPEDVLPAMYLCTNKIAADHENAELNIGGSLVASALEEACGTSRSKLRDMYNKLGDLGDVAQLCRQKQRLLAPPPPLLVKDVFSTLKKISVQTGSGSIVRKKNLIVNLMCSCREKEMKFVVRTLVRNLRIGAMMRTILPALAQAVAVNSFMNSSGEQKRDNVKEILQCLSAAVVDAYNVVPSLDLVVPSLLNKGIEFSTLALSMIPGVPIKPMLAKITNGVSQALNLFQTKAFACEYKYDGQRAQIHKLSDGSMRIFSRNGDETTSRFPDLVNIVMESCKHSTLTFIVDAEVVAVDRKNGCKLMSFQELSSRERGRRDTLITADKIKVDICVFVFDIMFANGQQLLEFPLRQRRKYLKDLFSDERAGYFEYAKEMSVEAHEACLTNESTLSRINSFLEESLHSSCEGIMLKSLDIDAGYSPSKRTDTWLKVKRDYVDGLSDSLDLVPIGAWHGNGRKAGWYSPFLMACYNPETEEYQSVCRVMSGFSDAFYIEMKEFFSGDRMLSKKPPYYRTAEVPDMWFSPELVWEIRGADFTISPVHEAAIGLVHPSRGISIRFPRFVRSVSDRNAEECSSAEDVADMFKSQTRKMDVTIGN